MIKIWKIIKSEIFYCIYAFFFYLPGYALSNKLRAKFLSLFVRKMGYNVRVNKHVTIEVPEKINIGNNVIINSDTWISGGGGLDIGDNSMIGPKTVIVTTDHNFSSSEIPIRLQGHTLKPVFIGNNVLISANCTVLGGVNIEDNVVIGAGTVVNKNLETGYLYVGNPVRKVKKI